MDLIHPEIMSLFDKSVNELKNTLDNELTLYDDDRKILQKMVRERFKSMSKEERVKLFRESLKDLNKSS